LESIFRPCTNLAATVMDHGEVPAFVRRAFAAMTDGRRRPAALILPQDLMAAATQPNRDVPSERPRSEPDHPNAGDVVKLIEPAQRPILLAGGGAVWAGAAAEVRALAQRLECPAITTLNGKGILDERDPYSLGHARSFKARVVLPQADLLVALGCRFTEV